MQFLKRYRAHANTPKRVPLVIQFKELVSKARRQYYAEDYSQALLFLDQAAQLPLPAEQRETARITLDLTRVDMHIAQNELDTAEHLLTTLQSDLFDEYDQHSAPYAYYLCSRGSVAQRRQQFNNAQDDYQQARDIAEAIVAQGATGRAIGHLADIYLAQDNAHYAVHLFDTAIKTLNQSQDHELLAYFLGQWGLALIVSGQAPLGEQQLKRALEQAKRLRQIAQIRSIHQLLGAYHQQQGRYHRAKYYYEQAWALYDDPVHDLPRYVDFLCRISQTYWHLNQKELALDFAESALTQAGASQDTALQSLAEMTYGIVQPDDALALDHLHSVLDRLETGTHYVACLRHLAQRQLALEQVEQGLATYQQALAANEGDSAVAGAIHCELAQAYDLQGAHRQAIRQWHAAITQYRDHHQYDALVRAHCDLAALHHRLGDGRLAEREYSKALEHVNMVQERTTRGILLANVAAGFSEFGDIDTANDFFLEAIDIAQETRNLGAEINRRANYGRLLALTNLAHTALSHLLETKQLAQDASFAHLEALVDLNIGVAYAQSTHFQQALHYFEQAQRAFVALKHFDWEARSIANKADTLVQRGHWEQAQHAYERVLDSAREYALVDVLIQATTGLAQIAIKQDKLAHAQAYLDKILPVAKRQHHRRLLANVYQVQSHLLAKQDKLEAAQASWEACQHLREIMRMPIMTADWL